MGEAQTCREPEQDGADGVIRPSFNWAIRVEGRPDHLTADAGAMAMREIMERTGMIDWLEAHFVDPRQADQVTHPLSELLRTELLLLAQGRTSAADADRLRDDPALRLSASDRRRDAPLRASPSPRTPEGLPSQPTLSRLLAAAADPQNLTVLEEATLRCLQQSCRWLDGRRRYRHLAVDVDSLPIEVHGQQAGSAYNGYFRTTCYHPLILGAAEHGHLFGAILRPGNANTADGAVTALADHLDWIEKHLAWEITVRGDAGFPADDLLCALEQPQVRPRRYVFRIRNYGPLQQKARPLVAAFLRDLGTRPEQVRQEPFRAYEMTYQGQRWSQARRVVLIIVPPQEGELLPRSFFLITNCRAAAMPAADLLALYRQRGTYEQQLGDFVHTLAPHLSSTTRPKRHYRGRPVRQHQPSRDAFDTNQAILSLHVLAHNLLNLGRRVAERAEARRGRPRTYGRSSPAMSLQTFRQRYLQVPARIILHSRQVWVTLSQSAANLWRHWWDYLDRLGSVSVVC